MREKVINHKNQALAFVLALLMTAVMPIIVLADNAQITINSPKAANTTIYTGDSFTLTASGFDATTNHIDWTSSNTSVATISKHNGVVTVVGPGSVTFTATVMDGAKPSGSGSGSGGGSNCTVSSGYDTASISYTAATTTAYGYQGTGGNTMYMTALNGNAITNISAGIETDGSYLNTINTPTAVAGTVSFGFMMSAGTNSFSFTSFNSNCLSQINIYKYNFGYWLSNGGVAPLTNSSFDASTGVITITSSSTLTAGIYKITFGPNVCGNNPQKTLGVPVSFVFTVV